MAWLTGGILKAEKDIYTEIICGLNPEARSQIPK